MTNSTPEHFASERLRLVVAAVGQRHRRLAILQVLAASTGNKSNERVIRDSLGILGYAISSDLTRTELAWLEEQGLVTISTPDNLYVVVLSERGGDVARGVAKQPGVATQLDC
jgi:hypothetical protein